MTNTLKSEVELLESASKYFLDKKYTKAVNLTKKTIKYFPNSPEAYYNLGLIYSTQEKYKEAIDAYKKASEFMPAFALARLNLGVTYIKNKQIDEGIKVFKKEIKVNPENHDAFFNLGLALAEKFEIYKAMNAFRSAIFLNPSYASSYYQMGSMLMTAGKIETAIHFFVKATELAPEYAFGYAALGTAYSDVGRVNEALEALDKALELGINEDLIAEPQYVLARKSCDWKRAKKYSKKLDRLNKKGLEDGLSYVEPPFTNIQRICDKKDNLRVSKFMAFTMENSKEIKPLAHLKKTSHKKIKVGYLSQDFRNHPVTSQIIDLFKYHDRKKFEIYSYSYGDRDSGKLRREIEDKSDHFVDLFSIDHKSIAERIYKDKIDILVDLVGYTGFQRPDILAYKPAPIQINYLGFPGTLGTNYVDYVIADKIVIPARDKKYYSEKIIYMPDCYQLSSHQKVSRKKFSRKSLGLPKDAFVFCSFNRQGKIEEPIFDSWMKILKKVPNSVLWLYRDNGFGEINLRKYAKAKGINPNRLIFANRVPISVHLSRLNHADLALDTQIYSGGATTANALWAEVPVVTIYGKHFLSRMSSSIITNIGMPELVTKNIKEYEDLAINMANNPDRLLKTAKKLKKNKNKSPLFDSKLFTKNLEKGYELVQENYMAGIKTDVII